MAEGRALRLIAEDAGDLEVISSAVQDAVLKAENIKFDRKRRRLTLEINRFQWEESKSRLFSQNCSTSVCFTNEEQARE